MTKNEALKKCIDGAKITHPSFVFHQEGKDWVEWNGQKFMRCGGRGEPFEVKDSLDSLDGWEIVPEYVDFFTAWKAYESDDRKTIQDAKGKKYRKIQNGCDMNFFGETAISGKWLILED